MAAALAASMAHAQVRPNLPEVRASIEREGAAATVNRLNRAGQWDVILDGMANGEPAWIAIAPLLAEGTDAGPSEGLGIALAQALPRAPAAVLHVLDPKDGPVLGASRVCSIPFVEPKPGVVEAYKPKAIAAVQAVRSPRLRWAREACLAALKKG
ncbi:hypothetical protein [Phenylobacterium sp.]|uniref:hypothetical protein n=1 Tax=Phenylobacterium sp. TaxID=1871053 RepID=UPI0012014F94|nr:hypothetical protein [Phenylobacterium sp.]THD62944.1 MAG: hypothetical protein E8A49_06195 [Phenylobacterium sp.]